MVERIKQYPGLQQVQRGVQVNAPGKHFPGLTPNAGARARARGCARARACARACARAVTRVRTRASQEAAHQPLGGGGRAADHGRRRRR